MKDRIRKIRKDLGMTQEGFANTLSLSRNFVSQLESGSYVIITGIVDVFEYKYKKILDKETCSFDLWIKDGNTYFKDYNWDILDCNESNCTALKSAKSGNKVKLCVYIYEGSTFGSADVIDGIVVDDKDHRKNIKKSIIKL